MALPSNISDNILRESEHEYREAKKEFSDLYASGFMDGYIVGADKYATRAQALADALGKLNAAIDKTWNECNTMSIPEKYKKEISAAQAHSSTALQSWNQKEGV